MRLEKRRGGNENVNGMRQVFYSSKFRKALKKMPRFVKDAFLEKEGAFLDNPFLPTLETHKLHGKYKEYWAFTVIGQYRVMFQRLKNDDAGLINIGTHDIYK